MRICSFAPLLKIQTSDRTALKKRPKKQELSVSNRRQKATFSVIFRKTEISPPCPEKTSQNFGFRTRSAHSLSFFDTLINLKKFKNKYFRNVKKYKQKKQTPVCALKQQTGVWNQKPNRDLA